MKMKIITIASAPLLAALALACGADADSSLPACDQDLCTVDDPDGDGARTTVIHAPDKDAPVYFRFAAPDAPPSAEEIAAGAWDLSFARTTIRANGGASGDGGVEVAWIGGAALTDPAPSEGWVSDGADEDAFAFSQDDGWYRYDLAKHVVEPRPRVYYVRATDGRTYALTMLSYYSHAGDSRYPTFAWLDVAE